MSVRPASPAINGARLRELRIEIGLSVTEAARRLNISVAYLSAIERGHRPTVPPARFNSICAAMGVERSELLADPARAA